ncbi:MAG: hypothetical protein EF813_12445 [Methanosarcinales archaeon]|nr:MAG: hypothetical protein EF813_12445 [Methanosarcinales archaeon]
MNSHRKSDRYTAFARNWKLIGITSRKKWRKSGIQDKVLWHVLEKIVGSNDGNKIINDACYAVGLLDGQALHNNSIDQEDDKNDICDTENKGKDEVAKTCLTTLELMCLLSGIHAELRTTNKKPTLKIMKCPYTDVLTGIHPPDSICKHHASGMIHAINRKSKLIRKQKMCAGDPYCEFMVDRDI